MVLKEIDWQDVELVPLTVRSQEQKNLSGILSVSRRPFVFNAVELAELAENKLDPQVKILSEGNVFVYLKLPINIRPGEEYDVRFLSIDLLIESENNQAVCWSMEPLRVEQDIKMQTNTAISSELKLGILKISATGSQNKEFISYQPIIEAFGIGQINPGWEFRPIKGHKLSGIQLLHLIVLIPKNMIAVVKVMIKADIFKEGWLWNYKARCREDREEVQKIELRGFFD